MLDSIVFLVYVAFFIPFIRVSIISLKKGEALEWKKWQFGILFGILGVIGIRLILWILTVYTEILWFQSLDYQSVFWTMFSTKWLLFLDFGLFCFIFMELNGWITKKTVPPLPKAREKTIIESRRWGYHREDWLTRTRVADWLRDIILISIAILMGAWAKSQWEEILLYLNQVAAGITDPIFHKDIGFYLFSFPIYRFISGWLLVLLFLTLTTVGSLLGFYGTRTERIFGQKKISQIVRKGIVHGSILAAGIVVILIWKTVLAIWGLLYSERGAVFGASYTDVHAQIGAYKFFIFFLAVAVILIIINAFKRSWKILAWTFSGLIVGWLLVVIIYPALVQQFSVKPSELDKETPYIKHNIAFTRQAFDLNKVEEKYFTAAADLSMEEIERNQITVENIRLWDWRALWDTFRQIQEIRLYYEFDDVDIDRYLVNGKYRQVMLSPRELPISELPQRSRTWINERFKYTHGYGLCLNAVNEFTLEGLPRLIVKDMPPVSLAEEIQVTRPEIYHGEMTQGHVFVKTGTKEFDHPKGDENVYSTYQGQGGVTIGKGLRKFAFAWRFDGIRILLSEYLKPESRIMFHRLINERIKTIAPFLPLDEDPYLVIREDGTLWWLQDAYTISKYYPYSERYDVRMNYIRNSVKVVIDAYNDKVFFYVFEETDPIIQTWQKVFPKLFRPQTELATDLKRHIRYPEDFLSIQAKMYAIYHMQDPQVFYNKEDLWEIAQETYIDTTQQVLPYYVIIRLPGEEKEEFIQMIPFTPTKKNNMIGWMAGRCDSGNYGKLLAYKFPKEKLIYGPLQVEARIDQHPEMSKAITLWNQMGSKVIRGNLLVIPVGNSLLYVEPLYLQAEQAKMKMPQIRKIIVAMGEKLEWGNTFEEALEQLFALKYPRRPEAIVSEEMPIEMKKPIELVRSANQHFQNYLKLMGEGKIVEAAQELEALKADLSKLLEAQK